jgi:Raf kinase inhibitor-like YbhB/YbcL family protein
MFRLNAGVYRWTIVAAVAIAVSLWVVGCTSGATLPLLDADGETVRVTDVPSAEPETEQKGENPMPFNLESSVFAPGGAIPARYTCDGDDMSPPLSWGEPPAGTRSFALIMDDPDAPMGVWDHWLLYNLPAEARSLLEGVPAVPELADGGLHGKNSWGRADYGGPCPPSGEHRYFFKLYALDAPLDLAPGADKQTLLQAMDSHVLAEAELMGVYERR